ncbi:hypothetical protein ACVPOR_02270 [Staphylococcus aureus]
MAVGYDNIDVESATANNVVVTNTPNVLTETTAVRIYINACYSTPYW